MYYINIIRQFIHYERPLLLLGRWKINSNEKITLERKIDLANYDNCGITRFNEFIKSYINEK